MIAAASCAPHRAITRMDIELLSETLAPRASAFAPGVVAWTETGDTWYQLVLQDGEGKGRRRVVEFSMPVMLGGGVGIAWLGYREPSADEELCVAIPDLRCAPAPRRPSNTLRLEVGELEGSPVVWFINGMGVEDLFRLDDDSWQRVELPREIHTGWSSVLPTSDGFISTNRGDLATWTRQDGEWTSTSLHHEVRGQPTLTDTHLFGFESGPTGPDWLHRVARDGTTSTRVQVDVGYLEFLIPHGDEGTLLVGSDQAEYWLGDQRMWQLPSSDMSGASWAGHPWVSIGSTRMRLDGPSIEVEDPTPGRFVWSERITPEIVACGDGLGLGWSHDDTPWRAWMAHGHVQIGHACPEEVDPWPHGKLTECAEGTRLEEDDHVACVAVSTRQYATRTSMVQLTRR
ncbi:MAG: hypothetical protein ACI8RZ_004977 [Myxococcota bacterium]